MLSREVWSGAVKAGLIAGVVQLYLAFVGLVEKLEVRNLVGSEVTAGRLLLAMPALAAAYIVVRPRIRGGELRVAPAVQSVPTGAVLGAALGAVTALGLVVIDAIGQQSMREIFVQISPGLLEIMQFGQGLGVAALMWIAGGAALGALGASLRLLPAAGWRLLRVGIIWVVLMALLQRIIPPAMRQVGVRSDWLYSPITGGLTVVGAVVVFALALGVSLAWRRWRQPVVDRVEGLPTAGRRTVQTAAVIGLVGFLLVLPNLVGSVLTNTLGSVGIFVLLALGLNIVVGYAGLLDLGYVAFFAVGAYTMAMFAGARVVNPLGEQTGPVLFNLDPWVALPLVVLVAAFVGLLIGAPVLRLRGDYLAIVTLGFGEIARVLVTSNALRDFAGGAQGLQAVPVFPGFSRDPRSIYYLVVVFVLLALYVSKRLADSRIGRAWNAMREDEQVAEAMGISTVRYKLLAFAIGGAVGSVGGALFAVKIGSLTPASFVLLVSITALAVVILGGMGSILGVVVGSVFLIGIPELLAEFEEFRLLIYGAVLVAVMILKPEGLVPNVKRMRELHDEERTQDQWFKKAGTGGADPQIAVAGAGEES